MKIQVTNKSVYGNVLTYPVCDSAKIFAKIAGQKTLTSETLMLILDLGYTVEQTFETMDFNQLRA